MSLISCQTITVKPKGGDSQRADSPDYEKSQDFFLFGLIGEATVPAGEICGDKGVAQLQSQTTFLDGLWPVLIAGGAVVAVGIVGLGLFANLLSEEEEPDPGTLIPALGGMAIASILAALAGGIWTPKTAKVWCAKDSATVKEAEEAI